MAFTSGNKTRIALGEREARQSPVMLRMREARVLCELSIEQVASLVRIHKQTIKMAELGIQAPSPKMRERLATLYGIPENILFWEWDEVHRMLLEKGGGLQEAIPEYEGRKGLYVEVHRRIQPNDD